MILFNRNINMILHSNFSIPSKFVYGKFNAKGTKRTPQELRKRRHMSFRRKVGGNCERPRLVVHRSNNHIYAQVIDDNKMHTLVAASTISLSLRELVTGNNVFSASLVGKEIARLCVERGISKVVFDRAGYLYHGKIKALANSARENGLIF